MSPLKAPVEDAVATLFGFILYTKNNDKTAKIITGLEHDTGASRVSF